MGVAVDHSLPRYNMREQHLGTSVSCHLDRDGLLVVRARKEDIVEHDFWDLLVVLVLLLLVVAVLGLPAHTVRAPRPEGKMGHVVILHLRGGRRSGVAED